MRHSRKILRFMLTAALLLIVSAGLADVELPALISDGMVIQADTEATVWGTADAGEKVTVKLADQSATTTADDDGNWMLTLDAMEAGGPYQMTVAGKNTLKLKNVMVGEVWVCSGQSNMAFTVNRAYNAAAEIQQADYPNIRLFSVKRKTSQEPLEKVNGRWTPCAPKTVKHFSAVGYFFGKYIHENLQVPVGLIDSSWGGTPAEAWTSTEKLKACGEFDPIFESWKRIIKRYPQAIKKYRNKRLPAWKKKVKEAKKTGKRRPRRPRPPRGPDSPRRPGNLFNAMIAPLLNFSIKGAIWYQGEANAGRAYQYRKLFPTMIKDWREKWGIGEFPFLFVQLANFRKVAPYPSESAWAELREAQLMTLDLPNTGIAVTIDIGEADDIHPKNKQDVGRRLGMSALGVAYDKDVPYSSPLYDSMSIQGDKIRIRFKHTFGLLHTPNDAPVNGFAIAGDDREFKWAHAKINGDCVIVSSYEVADPVAVRYGWGNNPVCNLYNAGGLPASPFRTDDWPGVTADKK